MGTRKRSRGGQTAASGQEQATPSGEAERQAVIARLFDGVLRSARSHLLRAEQPLAVEVWASGLLAVWNGLPSPDDDSHQGFGEALVRHVRALGTPESMAVLLALTSVAPARLSTQARTAATELEPKGVPTPAWGARVGRAVPTEAWIGGDVYGDQELLLVGFAYPESAPGAGDESHHSICVLVDHLLGGRAKDAYPAAPLPQTLARWREVEGDGLTLCPVSLAAVAGRLATALAATDFGDDHPSGDHSFYRGRSLAELRALLAARLAVLPPGTSPSAGELDADARTALVSEFLSSPEAVGLLAEPAVVGLCHSLVSYRCDFGDGDPRRWSPTLAGLCLLEHFPTRVSLDEPDIALVPDVLSAWVRFAGRGRGLPEAALGRILDAIAACREGFERAMGDAARYGPPPKRFSGAMLAQGIDLTDDAAVSEWLADYVSRH
jgi:hypothetical protein